MESSAKSQSTKHLRHSRQKQANRNQRENLLDDNMNHPAQNENRTWFTYCSRSSMLNDEKRVLGEIADKLGKHTKVADVHDGDIEELCTGKSPRAAGRCGPTVSSRSARRCLRCRCAVRMARTLPGAMPRKAILQGHRAQPRRGEGTILLPGRTDGNQRCISQLPALLNS